LLFALPKREETGGAGAVSVAYACLLGVDGVELEIRREEDGGGRPGGRERGRLEQAFYF
jgi:hypothetical protein